MSESVLLCSGCKNKLFGEKLIRVVMNPFLQKKCIICEEGEEPMHIVSKKRYNSLVGDDEFPYELQVSI